MSKQSSLVVAATLAMGIVCLCNVARADTADEAPVRVGETFGYDPLDSTRFVQKALDSGKRNLVFEKREWNVTPLRLRFREGLKITLEDGAWIVAKRCAFKDPYTALFLLDCCTNVTIVGAGPGKSGFKMWKRDYLNQTKGKLNARGYAWSEWRHTLSLLSCDRITIERLSSNESGGDGLYISTSGRVGSTPGSGGVCTSIAVRDCEFDANNRQGISVIGVDGFLAERVVMSNTDGTAPQAGIDFEPNKPWEKLTGIVMRDCLAINNSGNGFEIYNAYHDATSCRIDARFENCSVIGGRGMGFSSSTENVDIEFPKDDVKFEFIGCHFKNTGRRAISFRRKPMACGEVSFVNCTIENCGWMEPDSADLTFTIGGHCGAKSNLYRFENLKVTQHKEHPLFCFKEWDKPFAGKPTLTSEPPRFEGEIMVCTPDACRKVVLDETWRRQQFSWTDHAPFVPHVFPSLDDVEIVDGRPGELVDCTPICMRSSDMMRYKRRIDQTFMFHAPASGKVRIKLVQRLIGQRKYDASKSPIRVFKANGEYLRGLDRKLPVGPQGELYDWQLHGEGFYRLEIKTAGNGVAVAAADVPVAIDVADTAHPFIGSAGSKLYFYVPAKANFACGFSAGDFPERVKATVCDPEGRVVAVKPTTDHVDFLPVFNAAEGLWSLTVDKPEPPRFIEDYNLALNGVPGWYFLNNVKYWK